MRKQPRIHWLHHQRMLLIILFIIRREPNFQTLLTNATFSLSSIPQLLHGLKIAKSTNTTTSATNMKFPRTANQLIAVILSTIVLRHMLRLNVRNFTKKILKLRLCSQIQVSNAFLESLSTLLNLGHKAAKSTKPLTHATHTRQLQREPTLKVATWH